MFTGYLGSWGRGWLQTTMKKVLKNTKYFHQADVTSAELPHLLDKVRIYKHNNTK